MIRETDVVHYLVSRDPQLQATYELYQDLLNAGSYAAAKEKGQVRVEGKEYVMQDGDVVLFRFNV